jgi:hydrogenase nickel incorporation protein HypA/HybF
MHELSITQQVLELAVNKAAEAGAKTVKRINLVTGDMCGIVDDCMQFYFDIISQDSTARGAKLSFQKIPVKVRCLHCCREFIPLKEDWRCPQCQTLEIEVIAGRELYLESIEVEE